MSPMLLSRWKLTLNAARVDPPAIHASPCQVGNRCGLTFQNARQWLLSDMERFCQPVKAACVWFVHVPTLIALAAEPSTINKQGLANVAISILCRGWWTVTHHHAVKRTSQSMYTYIYNTHTGMVNTMHLLHTAANDQSTKLHHWAVYRTPSRTPSSIRHLVV